MMPRGAITSRLHGCKAVCFRNCRRYTYRLPSNINVVACERSTAKLGSRKITPDKSYQEKCRLSQRLTDISPPKKRPGIKNATRDKSHHRKYATRDKSISLRRKKNRKIINGHRKQIARVCPCFGVFLVNIVIAVFLSGVLSSPKFIFLWELCPHHSSNDIVFGYDPSLRF